MTSLIAYTEADFAPIYAQAACADCEADTCDLGYHDESAYYDLPDDRRAELRARASNALGNSSVPEVVWDVMGTVARAAASEQKARAEAEEKARQGTFDALRKSPRNP